MQPSWTDIWHRLQELQRRVVFAAALFAKRKCTVCGAYGTIGNGHALNRIASDIQAVCKLWGNLALQKRVLRHRSRAALRQ